MAKAMYSVVQYCPDRFRAEAVNVGLVMLAPDLHVTRVRITGNHDRVKRLFGTTKSNLRNLRIAVQSLKSRIDDHPTCFESFGDLSSFAATRANDLRLTDPRLAIVKDFDADFDRLFESLVEMRTTKSLSTSSPAEVLPPSLGDVFYRLQSSHRIWRPGKIMVPVYNRTIEVPYAYRNGVVNYVVPHVFPATKRAESQAALLAVNGDLIRKHPDSGEKRQLIVVSTQETPKQAKQVEEHVVPLFKEYSVRLVRPDDADSFASEIERVAH